MRRAGNALPKAIVSNLDGYLLLNLNYDKLRWDAVYVKKIMSEKYSRIDVTQIIIHSN